MTTINHDVIKSYNLQAKAFHDEYEMWKRCEAYIARHSEWHIGDEELMSHWSFSVDAYTCEVSYGYDGTEYTACMTCKANKIDKSITFKSKYPITMLKLYTECSWERTHAFRKALRAKTMATKLQIELRHNGIK